MNFLEHWVLKPFSITCIKISFVLLKQLWITFNQAYEPSWTLFLWWEDQRHWLTLVVKLIEYFKLNFLCKYKFAISENFSWVFINKLDEAKIALEIQIIHFRHVFKSCNKLYDTKGRTEHKKLNSLYKPLTQEKF